MARPLYKVTFLNHGKSYELYAARVAASDLYGFVEVAELQFQQAGVVLDPVEEKLREEFGNTRVLHLPMHAVVRVEEVRERAAARIRDSAGEKIIPLNLGPPRP